MRIYESDDGAVKVEALDGDNEGHEYALLSGHVPGALNFQQGTVPEAGYNGTTNEAVIACLVHRLEFLNGKFPCRENALAITKLQEALMWLEARTTNRKVRGVEGKHEK